MSLQFESVRGPFVAECVDLWRNWLQGPQAGRTAQREARLSAAIRHITAFMVTPNIVFRHIGGWGAFNWTDWRLSINRHYTGHDDIRYKNFVEICSTIYHETRHAEQFYRIAQGLAAGTLKFPDVSSARMLQEMGAGNSSVRSRIALFEAASTGRNLLQEDRARGTAAIANWLSIPANVAEHANSRRDYFANYISAAKPAWFKRSTVLDEINEWMRASYKKTFSEMDSWAQGDDGPYRIYRDLPEENDAHGIEKLVQAGIYQWIGHDTPLDRKKRRTDVTFGP
jgi:hypothetical protein